MKVTFLFERDAVLGAVGALRFLGLPIPLDLEMRTVALGVPVAAVAPRTVGRDPEATRRYLAAALHRLGYAAEDIAEIAEMELDELLAEIE